MLWIPLSHCSKTKRDLSAYTLLIQDDIIVGVDLDFEEIYCFDNPYSTVSHVNGHRTSSDYWYFDEDHIWYEFKYIGE